MSSAPPTDQDENESIAYGDNESPESTPGHGWARNVPGRPRFCFMSAAGPPWLARRFAVRVVESVRGTMNRVALGTSRLPTMTRLPTTVTSTTTTPTVEKAS